MIKSRPNNLLYTRIPIRITRRQLSEYCDKHIIVSFIHLLVISHLCIVHYIHNFTESLGNKFPVIKTIISPPSVVGESFTSFSSVLFVRVVCALQ